MSYLSEKKFQKQMQEIQRDNLSKKRKHELRKERFKYFPKLKFPSTSKLILLGAILLCLQIVLFCEHVMITTGDTSAMYVLIGIPATLAPIIMSYYNKSKAENTSGGIVFEAAMKESEQVKSAEEAMG